ncbi:MAG: leucine-rich repeat domain-containing protein [Imperialibacter sp.]|uniref:leucine-rich repeat domain-containing protein n=1 Tax=Imperialibacter sp. TaxID=2038411 RepID=UPI0032F02124
MKTVIMAFSTFLSLQISTVAGQIHPKNVMSLNEALENSTTVEWLTLRDQGLVEFPPQILSMPHLKYIDLSLNNISSIPDEIGSLQDLRFIDLSGNRIEALPHGFSELAQLSNVYLGHNWPFDLSQGLEVLSKLPNLRVLDLTGNRIQHLPSTIGKLSNLRFLELSNNPIERLPGEFSGLKNLHILSVTGAETFTLEKNMAVLSRLPNLKTLHFSDSHFTESLPSSAEMRQFAAFEKQSELSLFENDWQGSTKKLRLTDNRQSHALPNDYFTHEYVLSPNVSINF